MIATRGYAIAILCGIAVTTRAMPAEPRSEPAVRIEWGVKVPMRDGAELAANVYHPALSGAGKRPGILTLTPYTADRYHQQAMFFARNGYTFVVVDVRGRGNSAGEYWPYEKEGEDGRDVVQWMTRQPWCDGKVGMWGGSAAGYNQWATLKEFPQGLATIVPIASGHPGFDMPAYKNVFSGWALNWFASVAGRAVNNNFEGDLDYWTRVFRSHYLALRPFDQLDEHVGMPSAAFERWLSHPSVDGYWDAFVPDPAAYRRIEIPILTITGHHDGVQRGALEFHRLHMQHGSDAGRARHFLVIGPWNHAGTRKPQRKVGGVQFGEKSLVDIDQLHLDWYDWTLRDGPRPAFLEDQVTYYIEERDEWRAATSLDTMGTKPRRLFFSSGALHEQPGPRAAESYLYDPRDTRAGAAEPMYGEDYLLDTSPVTNLFGAGLLYETPPLASDLTIAGRARAELWLEMDAPDTDVELLLYQVRPDGTSIRLAQDHVRVRYRDSLRKPAPAPLNEVFRVVFPDFSFFARRIERGSRLRLLIHAPNSIYTQKNYNSGGDVSRESGAVARRVRVVVHQGGRHASFIELPIADPPR